MKKLFTLSLITVVLMQNACTSASKQAAVRNDSVAQTIVASSPLPGADQLSAYLPLLKGKKVGLMGNQTSIVGKDKEHLVDVLLREKVNLKFGFAPEHGFRGNVERGEKVSNDVDEKTGLPLYTLYGGNEKQDSIVKSVDVMIFDLQDVGARFYTYITSLHRVMELCAKHNKELIVLDRPNPNGDQVDGPVRKDDKFKSNVSFHKIAMIHGLTVGELAHMINGEKWLEKGKQCKVTVIPVKNYDHKTMYDLPVIPSPSLPNHLSVRLYTSLCLFEGTDISVGRGTDWPFQVVGYTDPVYGQFTFTPSERAGMVKHVEGKGTTNYGIDLRNLNPDEQKFTLKYILHFYDKMPDKSKFFVRAEFFDKLAGTDELRKQILAGKSEQQIRDSWKQELSDYKKMRKQYLLYPDFE
ncbi:exo-beta-N-acetylmuramidase NamZ family protein [Sphingobacterium spiritivorum]|uniref:exo-beta-N-acetylmuramidase NamZ family protein n=1 Tax=Sphingobacterium spiritivorum TaxID=258 RepID=UPI003DA6C692